MIFLNLTQISVLFKYSVLSKESTKSNLNGFFVYKAFPMLLGVREISINLLY